MEMMLIYFVTDAPTIFRIAGFDTNKSQWLSGLNNVTYMVRRDLPGEVIPQG